MLKSKTKNRQNPAPRVADARVRENKKHTVRTSVFAGKWGKTIVKINSKNAHRALAELSKIDKVKVQKMGEDYIVIAVKSKHLSQFIAILNKLCYDYTIIGAVGVAPSFFRILARWGIVVGIIICAIAAIFCTSFVTRVDVVGCASAPMRLEVLALLEENGVKTGGKTANVNLETLQKSILALDGVAFASVRKYGGRIYVFVKEELSKEEFEELGGAPVTATKRAVVTRVIVDGGTAVVKYGDVVSAGDILIDGFTEYGDERLSVRAAGEVWGKVYYQKKLYFADTICEKSYGKTKTVSKLSFFGKIPKTPKCDFLEYELKISVQTVGFLVPYTVYRFEFKETKSQTVERKLTLDEMKKQAFSSLVAEIDSAIKILDVNYDFEDAAGGKYVTVTIEAEERIS